MSQVILVTGANQGIGFELVRQLATLGHKVYLGARSQERGKEAIAKLEAQGLKNVRFLQLDVTDSTSVNAAVKQVESEQGHLDVLVNNAGIALEPANNGSTVDVELVKKTYETNVFGVIRVTTAFVPLLKKSSNPVILNISSGLGSVSGQADPTNVWSKVQLAGYNSSKAALNAYTIALAADFTEARVNVISPGYVATNLNAYSGNEPIDKSAEGVIKRGILIGKDGPTSQFLDHKDKNWAW
eukprot:TRINITY_DN3808_c0_g2_i2.p1 TRINITY_DN3808_c0_g2~~TRINITY_DN3808_c0_g2_i2.p1  ORF type:complete len:242 (-),score=58.83 TRINITY_DN3808_c0_g2_i2:54-779(-)